jgi:hypothetical protein
VELVRQRAGIAPGQNVVLVPYPPKRSLFEVLMNRSEDTNIVEAESARMIAKIPGGDWINAAMKGGMLMLMPYRVTIQ